MGMKHVANGAGQTDAGAGKAWRINGIDDDDDDDDKGVDDEEDDDGPDDEEDNNGVFEALFPELRNKGASRWSLL